MEFPRINSTTWKVFGFRVGTELLLQDVRQALLGTNWAGMEGTNDYRHSLTRPPFWGIPVPSLLDSFCHSLTQPTFPVIPFPFLELLSYYNLTRPFFSFLSSALFLIKKNRPKSRKRSNLVFKEGKYWWHHRYGPKISNILSKSPKKTGTLASKRQTTSVGLMIVPIFRCVIKMQLIPHFAYFCTEVVFIVDANFNWDNYNLCRSSSARQGKISANIGNVLLKKDGNCKWVQV